MTLVAIIALGIGGFILAVLAIAYDEPIDRASPRARSVPRPRRRDSRRRMPLPARRDAAFRWPRSDARTKDVSKPSVRPGWRGTTNASMVLRNKASRDLQCLRAWGRRRGVTEREAAWVAASVAFSVVLGYLIAQI